MNRSLRLVRILVFLLSVAVLATMAWGAVRPFRTAWMTSFDNISIGGSLGCPTNVGEPTFTFDLEAGGVATHLGRNTLVGVSEVSLVDGDQCGRDIVVTAANGDELWFDFDGISATDATGLITFSGDYTITGGTGRFAGAGGSGTYEGSADSASTEGEWFMAGTIDY